MCIDIRNGKLCYRGLYAMRITSNKSLEAKLITHLNATAVLAQRERMQRPTTQDSALPAIAHPGSYTTPKGRK